MSDEDDKMQAAISVDADGKRDDEWSVCLVAVAEQRAQSTLAEQKADSLSRQ